MQRNRGFSLIELLIVVAIILVIAAIAIPNLLASRMSANEASAVGSLQAIKTAEYAYSSAYPTVGYATQLSDLGGTGSPCVASSTGACLLDTALVNAIPGGPAKSGFMFLATGIINRELILVASLRVHLRSPYTRLGTAISAALPTGSCAPTRLRRETNQSIP